MDPAPPPGAAQRAAVVAPSALPPGAVPRVATVLAVAALTLALATGARAQGLASPGPLATAHARLDNLSRCLDCHDAGRELSGRKCLLCHASLARRIRADSGYHAVLTQHGAALACRTCHSEHNGRPFRLVKWEGGGKDAFDHHKTGWALDGAHGKLRCESCHKARLVSDPAVRRDSSLAVATTYLGLGTACAACHLDEHRGRTSRDCQDCHDLNEWKPAPRFDHTRTRFALTGLHATLRCAQCHATRSQTATGPDGTTDASFVDFHASKAGWATGCIGCHPSPHREAGRVGACEKCHTTEGWFALPDSVRRFDHTAIGFPLRGAHAAAACETCHLPSERASLPAGVALVREDFLRPFRHQKMAFARCDACHEDVHRGQLSVAQTPSGKDCGACHGEVKFTPTTFTSAAHDSTRFPLTGAHAATPCSACHPAAAGAPVGSGRVQFRRADLSCAACHQDPHGGQFAARHVAGSGPAAPLEAAAHVACTPCHNTAAWDSLSFDHGSTRYPLRGAHRTLACAKCHVTPGPGLPAKFSGLPLTCDGAGCHADPHGGQFADRPRGGTCTTCHSEVAWATLTFDHQRDTDYPLDGAHSRLRCVACHKSEGSPAIVRYRPLPHRCEDCHPTAAPGGRSL